MIVDVINLHLEEAEKETTSLVQMLQRENKALQQQVDRMNIGMAAEGKV